MCLQAEERGWVLENPAFVTGQVVCLSNSRTCLSAFQGLALCLGFMRDARNLGSQKPTQIPVLPVVLSFTNVCNTVLQNSKFCRTKCEMLNACCFYSFSFIIHNLNPHYPPLFPSPSHQAPLYNKPPSLPLFPSLPCLPVHLMRVACISIWGIFT